MYEIPMASTKMTKRAKKAKDTGPLTCVGDVPVSVRKFFPYVWFNLKRGNPSYTANQLFFLVDILKHVDSVDKPLLIKKVTITDNLHKKKVAV